MIKYSDTYNHKKSNNIPIRKNLEKEKEYSLKENFFDPTKNSPPNDFMIKLYSRLLNYESLVSKSSDILDNK